jgi:hypothetical protein
MPDKANKKQSPEKGRPSYLGDKPKRITFDLPADLHDGFRKVSLLKGDSMANLLRDFISNYIDLNKDVLKIVSESLNL